METSVQIKKFQEFLELNYKTDLLEKVRKGDKYLVIDFSLLSSFEPELANFLLDEPEETIKACEIAIEQFDLPGDVKNFRIRVKNIPPSQKIFLRDIRSEHLNQLIWVEGIVRQKGDVRPHVTSARFECPNCGNIISVLQLDKQFKEPTKCGCGRKGKFHMLSKELIDAQGLKLEESADDLEGGEQPKKFNVLLKNDLVSPISEKKTNPGQKIRIIGMVKEVPMIMKNGAMSTTYDLIIEGNNAESIEENMGDLKISKEEEEKIKEIAKNPKYLDVLKHSLIPSIYGHDKIKEAMLLQIVGGVKKRRDDGVVTRGDMHILLIGDPGAGKCLTGDSKVLLNSGEIISIKELFERQKDIQLDTGCYSLKEDIKVASFREDAKISDNKVVKLWVRKSPSKTLKITTSSGDIINVTEEHPLFTTNNGLIHSVSASDLKQGDFIACLRNFSPETCIQSIYVDFERSRANNRIILRYGTEFDRIYARLFGYLTGDGYVRFMRTSGVVSFTNKNTCLLNDFRHCIKAIFGLDVKTREKKGNLGVKEQYVNSIELVRFLHGIESSITNRSDGMKIPKIVLKSPNYVLKEFLSSLFDCEAHITDREIQLISKSRDLVDEIKVCLLRFGILSQISEKIKYAANTKEKIRRKYHELRISGIDVVRFKDNIGFISEAKNSKLIAICSKEKIRNTNKDIIPNIDKVLKTIRIRYGLTQYQMGVSRSAYLHYELGDRNPSRESFRRIVERLKKIDSNDIQIRLLEELSDSNIFWNNIRSIELIDAKDDYVYDIEVEHTHNFITSSVMVHNSQILKRIQIVSPKSRFVAGKGASGAGLTVSVVKDEFLSGWSLEAGALVLANKGICCIDEFDKMTKDDRSAMHEALEQQTVTISKANIQATLRAETTVLAAANPKFGRFDPYASIAEQIDLPPSLINRFDLIFPIKDLPDEKKDNELASFILDLHQKKNVDEPEVPTELLRKYFAYVKQKIFPTLNDEAIVELKTYFLKMRSSGSGEGSAKSIPISARQLEGLIRIAEAYAKLRLSDTVTKNDAKKAVDMLHYCLRQIALDEETGNIDIDKIATGIASSQRNKIFGIKEIITELEAKLGKTIPLDDIIEVAKGKGFDEEKVTEVIDKLKRSGDIFEPKRGFIQKV